jgi:hypothetical protein
MSNWIRSTDGKRPGSGVLGSLAARSATAKGTAVSLRCKSRSLGEHRALGTLVAKWRIPSTGIDPNASKRAITGAY